MPDGVLSTQDLSFISADNNIFEIMNKAQETCNGTDMRCTFYHFFNNGYDNIGTLNINKERFDDLLMKFDNWLLSAEDIEKSGNSSVNGKTKEDSSLETASIGVNDGFSHENSSEIKGDQSQDGHIDKSDDDGVHSHHLKSPHEIHHKIHHGKDHNSLTAPNIHGKQWKNENHIKLNPEYNANLRYFEVYIPNDELTGKPRTIYVEVDEDKNEFILLDEEIDKKLNGIKPIRIELDELSGIADTVFNKVAETSNFKEHVHNDLTDDEKAIISETSNHAAVNVDKDVGEQTQKSINPSVSYPYIYNKEAEEQHKTDYMTGNVKEIINDEKNLIVPNKYINQAQFNIESHIENSTDDMQNDQFELQESNDTEIDIHTDLYEKEEPLDTIEYNDNNTFCLNGTENSFLDYSDISYENDNDTSTDYYELPTEHENSTLDGDSFVQLEEHNDTYHDIDYDDTHDFSSPNTLNLNGFTVELETPVQGNNLKSTPFNNAEPKLTSSVTDGISDYTGSQLHTIPFENRLGYADLHDLTLEPSLPLKPYTNVPILGKDSANILKTDSSLTSSPLAYATQDLHAGVSQNTPFNSVVENPSITSYISPLDSVCTQSATPKISQYSACNFPSPPLECFVRLNKDKYSPLSVGVSWLPSLRLPSEMNPLSLDHVFSSQDSISPLTVPSMEYIGSSQSSPNHATPGKDKTFIQSVPSSSYVIQEPSLITTPCELETTAKLGLPESNTGYERIPTPYPASVKSCSLKDAVGSPCPIQQISPCLQRNILNPIDSGLIKKSPCETMSPCSANSNRYPYTTIPFFSNPYLTSPQFIPSYLEPILQTPLQPAPKIPSLDSVPISLDQSNPCLTGVYPQDKKPIQFLPFAPNSQFSPLNPMSVEPGFPRNALPCPNIWNNIPYLPYTNQNIRNNPPFHSNYLTSTTDQNHKPLLSKTVPLSIVEHPCSSNNIIEITPSSYTPCLPVHTSQVQNDLYPSLALERDLESLSLKYGIPLSKILHSIKMEISDSKTCLPTLEVPYSNLKYDGSLTAQDSYTLSETNDDLTNLTPLDSSLIGPHLELENSLDAHDTQRYTILSETAEPITTPHYTKTQQNTAIKDSSLIGPQLSTLCSSNILFSDDNRSGYELVLSESDSSNLMHLDASLTGPHLKISNPTAVLDSHIKPLLCNVIQNINEMIPLESDLTELTPVNISQVDLTNELCQSTIPAKPLLTNEVQTINEMIPLESDLTDFTPVDISQVDLPNELCQSTIIAKPLLTNEIQTITEMIPLESDLTELTPVNISQVDLTNELCQSTIIAKPLLTNEVQTINEMIPLQSDLTDLTPEDFVNEPSEILQHEKSIVTLSANPMLHKTAEYLPTNLEGPELLLDSDSSCFIPLDSSLIGPELNLESLPVITETIEDKLTPTVSQDNVQKTDIKHDELESIILPSSMLPTLLNKPVKADSNFNTNSQDTKLNEELFEMTVDDNLTPLKETDYKIVEPIKLDLDLNINTQNTQLNEKQFLDSYVEMPLADTSQIFLKEADFKIVEEIPELHDSNITPLLPKDSTTLKDKLTSPVMSLVEYEPQLESSLIGTSILPKLQRPVISSTSDSSIQLDNYLVGPSILNEIDSQSPEIDCKSLEQKIKPSESRKIDSNIQFDSSLLGPTVCDSVTQFDTSLVGPSLYEAGTKTSSVSNAESHLDTTLLAPSLYDTVEASASSSCASQLDSSLLGTSLKPEMESLEVSHVFDSQILDSTLVGPHLSTASFSDDEVQMINNELHQKSEFANLIPLDSTLIGPHLDFESQLDQSEISIYQSDLQELLSKFENSITKSQLSPSECRPCDKLLSLIAKQSTDNINLSPTCSDLQPFTWNTLLNTPLSLLDDTASKFSPITITEKEFSPLGSVVKKPCINDFSLVESLPYAQGVPQIPITPYSPFIQMRPLVDRNWIPQPLNILQAAPGVTPAVGGNAPVPFISNALLPLAPQDVKLFLDLASQSKTFPQLSMPNIFTPMKAVPPSLEWTTLSNNLPLEKYVPSLPKKNYSLLPSSLESSVCNSEYTPIEVDDIMSLLDGNSYKLLQDMSILPVSQSSLTPSIPVFETGEIVSPSLSDTLPILTTTRPVSPLSISNAMVPSSMYTNRQIGLYNPQNIPYMLPTPNIPPCSLQPYSITPLDALFSEIIGPVSEIESLPIESSKSSLESQWQEIPNTPQLMESFPNSTLDSQFLQQLLSKPCLESPIILPSSLLDTMLQLSADSNKFKSYPCQSPPEFFTPVSPALTSSLSNAYTSPELPIYASPLSISYAKPISSKSTSLPPNVPYAPSSLTPLPISPYPPTVSSVIPDLSGPLRLLKSTPLSNYPIAPREIYNRPVPSRIPYKPSQIFSSPYLPVYPSPLPVENNPSSPTFMSKLTPAETSPISPIFYEPLTAPYCTPEHKPKSLTNFGTPTYSGSLTPVSPISMASSTTGVLPSSYISPDLSTYKYLPISATENTLTQPSSTLSPAYVTPISPITPVSSALPSYSRPLSSKPMFNLNLEITPQELENLKLQNTLPVCNANNPYLNANQMLLTSSNILPLQDYHEYVPKSSPFYSSKIKQIKPSEYKTESNLQTTSLTEETPYEIIEENMCAYGNDEDNKYYEDYNFKHPLESLSCTLAPEDMETERIPKEDFVKQEDLTLSAPITNLAFEPSVQSKLYRRPLLTPCAPLYGEPLLRPCPIPQLLPHPSLFEPQTVFDNIPLEPSLRPLNHPVSLPASILSSPLLKPITPLTPAVNLPLLSSPCVDTYLRPYKVLPTDELLFSSPYYSATSQDMLASPIDPRGLSKIISPQLTSAFSQVSAPFVPISSPASSPTSLYNLDNYFELPLTYNKPQSKEQYTLVKPITVTSYDQYVAPIISHISPLEMPISSQYITPLTPAESLKKPLISPQSISSILPAQTKLQETCPLNEALLNYQPYIPLPAGPSNAAKNIFKSLLITSPYTVIPSPNMVEPMSTNLNSPLWPAFNPQYYLPVSSSPISKSSPVNYFSNVKYSTITPDVGTRPMSNHIIPSSLFMSSDTDFQTIPLKKLTPLQSPPRYSYPSPTLIEPFEIVPNETPKKPLGQTILPQNIFKPNTQYYNGKYAAVPLSSSPSLTQPLEIIDSFQTQPNVQYTKKPLPKLSPILAESPSLAPGYTSLPLETVPNSQINKPRVPQFSLANVPTYDALIQSSPLARNPFLNQDFKLITEVPAYPVPDNQISPLKLTPYESILLSNLKPLGISQEALESSKITSSIPLSLLKPLTKTLTQKSGQYQPEMIPIDSQYVPQSQIDSVPQLLPCTSPILKSPLLKPILTNIQNYSPSLPNYVSNSNTAFSDSSPMKSLPSISSNQKYSAPSESLVSELPEILEPMTPIPVTPYSFLKPSFYKQYQSPNTMPNMPKNSNYNVLESSPCLPIKENYINTVKPIEVSPISSSESSRLSFDSLDSVITEEMIPYELRPDLKDKFSYLPLNLNQQRQFYPLSFLMTSQPTHITSASSKYKTARPTPCSIPSVIPEDVELIDTTDFIPILPIQSEASTSSYAPVDKKAPTSITASNIPESNTLLSSPYTILSNTDFSPSTFKQLPPTSITNTQSIQEPDISQFFPFTILSNSDFSLSNSKQLSPAIQKQRGNQRPQSSPIYLSPQEFEELTKGLSSQAPSSSPIDSQLITNLLAARPIPLTPLHASPISKTPEDLIQFPLFGKYSPLRETPIEITPEKENIQSILNKYRAAHKIIPLGVNNYLYEPKSSIVELLTECDSVNPLIKSKESYVKYTEDTKSNDESDYVIAENVSLDENKEIIKGVNIPNYYNDNNVQRPQRLSKLDQLYAYNHIGKGPQVFTVPTCNTSPISLSTDDERSYTIISPEIYKEFTETPTKHLGSAPKLDKSSRLTEYYPEITNSIETVPSTNSYTQNYINPSLKPYSQIKPTNTIEVTDNSEIPSSSSYNPFNNIKYSGYKTYQIPSLKSPKTMQNLGPPPQMHSPSLVPYSPLNPGKPPNVYQTPSPPEFYEPTEMYEPITPQYQAPQKITSPLQTELSLDTLHESPEYNDYSTIKDEPVCVDDIKEDNELKTSLINYINKNNIDTNNQELTIPIGLIAITKKAPYDADTIETNNPSIGLKIWKSNIKLVQAELKLKFKDLPVINFMPIVNNLDKYDTEEIRKLVKNYIDERYGNHVEITEPYTMNNQYTIIKDFDPNAVSNKYNLLWPTHYF